LEESRRVRLLVGQAFPEDFVSPLAGDEGVRAGHAERDEAVAAQDML
jgi:hypothetical protein